MSYNDRLREAAAWVAAHRGETITLTLPKADLAEALWDASDDCRWPYALGGWARDLARNARGMSAACYLAEVRWEDRDEPLIAPMAQPTHADCARSDCTCPCHGEAHP